MSRAKDLTPHEIREIAVIACCDPRTVRAYVNGHSQSSTTSERIARALAEWREKFGAPNAAALTPLEAHVLTPDDERIIREVHRAIWTRICQAMVNPASMVRQRLLCNSVAVVYAVETGRTEEEFIDELRASFRSMQRHAGRQMS